MIFVDNARCSGCAACMGVCPHGAIALQNGTAMIAGSLCSDCQQCLDVCPHGAIVLVEPAVADSLPIPSNRTLRISPSGPQALQPSVGQQITPLAHAVLLWAGREVLPRLVESAFEWIDRHQILATPQRSLLGRPRRTTTISSRASHVRNSQRRRERHRQRGAGR